MIVRNEHKTFADFYATQLRLLIMAQNEILNETLDNKMETDFKDIPPYLLDCYRSMTDKYIVKCGDLFYEMFSEFFE